MDPFQRVGGLERKHARKHLIQSDTQRVKVAAGIGRYPCMELNKARTPPIEFATPATDCTSEAARRYQSIVNTIVQLFSLAAPGLLEKHGRKR